MAAKDPETRAHLDWLGMLQPVGLVVSPPAMVKAQAVVPRNAIELQKRFVAALEHGNDSPPRLHDFPRFAHEFLDWEPEDLVGADALPRSLEIALPEYQQVLAPTWAVPEPDAKPDQDGARPWLMLIVEVETGTDFDDAGPRDARGWRASPQIRLERLLRDTKVAIGLLVGPDTLRLVYAPAGESSGHLSFPISAMTEVGGRPILAAFHMLCCGERLFTLPSGRRLPALLADSRKYQNEVSTKLSEQVLRALGELLRGFVAADDAVSGELLGTTSREHPQHIYGGLITTMMRLVFLLYAEERELMPQDPVYAQYYGVSGLFEALRADAGQYPDTMDQRYGAWSRLLSLFRLVFSGGAHGSMQVPARQGQLFNPEEFPFLEGRPYGMTLGMDERIVPPRVSDGVVYRVLEDLLILEGERLSYRSLDVEQIGSVYEAIMGFEVKRAFGPSIGLRPQHVVVNLQTLLDAKPKQRAKLLDSEAGCKLAKGAAKALEGASGVEELVAALGSRISPQTPTPLAPGSLYLQPTEERRRSGSHYTPRSLTEPIVRTTLRPVLEELGERPTAAQILALKVCDPAMGSGAFLVEACRQLAAKLEEAWAAHGQTPTDIPPDETVELHARRLVAQRCLYGVDKNPFAVNLAKVSLWLVTLARDHAFTFIDHSLKCGDSLVGLTRRQIEAFHWQQPEQAEQELPLFAWVTARLGKVSSARAGIFSLGDEGEAEKRACWREAEDALDEARLMGDLVISAFFAEGKDKAREQRRLEVWDKVRAWRRTGAGEEELRGIVDKMRGGATGVVPFHWELEFPELFSLESTGFKGITGNPPFLGGKRISTNFGDPYRDWLRVLHADSSSNADMAAHFFRRGFDLLMAGGTVSFVATNTISQGATRASGLGWITAHGGSIFAAKKRIPWPGQAAVVISTVHIRKGPESGRAKLDDNVVERISPYLVAGAFTGEPTPLAENAGVCHIGNYLNGAGFTFDDEVADASSIETMRQLIHDDPARQRVIFPYIGGAEILGSPTQSHHRFAIDLGGATQAEARSEWPALMAILEAKVKPGRLREKQKADRVHWWQHARKRTELRSRALEMQMVLVHPNISTHVAFAFVPARTIVAAPHNVFLIDAESGGFACLQSRVHELWARFFGSSMKDDLRYTPSSCFDTFPLLPGWRSHAPLTKIGAQYYVTRADLMVRNDEGLTATYNRFHDPSERSEDLLALRELHDHMDRAVLDAYGWTDIHPTCEFLLDYEDQDDDSTSKRKKPWRYRWPDELQERVLGRLLDLNHQRAKQHRLAGATTDTVKPKTKRASNKQPAAATQPSLFPNHET